jgi:hypothetical protein
MPVYAQYGAVRICAALPQPGKMKNSDHQDSGSRDLTRLLEAISGCIAIGFEVEAEPTMPPRIAQYRSGQKAFYGDKVLNMFSRVVDHQSRG